MNANPKTLAARLQAINVSTTNPLVQRKTARALAKVKAARNALDAAELTLAWAERAVGVCPVVATTETVTKISPTGFSIFEFGYKCCEKGMNLDAALIELKKVFERS